jgi:hypothetical protein
MEAHGINYLAVVVAAIAYMALGALWYSPALFGRAWMRLIGKSKEQIAADFKAINYLWAIIAAFLASYGIARLMLWTGLSGVGEAIKLALLVGVSFVLAAMWVNDSFEARPRALTLVNVAYHVAGLIVAAIILGVW